MQRTLVLTLLTIATAAPGPLAAQFGQVAVDIRVPVPPLAVVAHDSARFVYELQISNLRPDDLTVREIQVTDDFGVVLVTLGSDSLRRHMGPLGGPRPTDGRVIGGGRRAMVFLSLATTVAGAPRTLVHRIVAVPADTAVRDTVVQFRVEVPRRRLPVLQSPFANGGVWVAVNGPGNVSGHRRTALPIDGRLRIPQRFATDWIMIGENGKPFHGDSTRNENWYGHGQPIAAVAAGTVVATKDGIIENVPFSPTMAVPITLETVGGNHVILDLGDGFFAFYAHIKPGSVAVKVGDRVRPGQTLGLLGNSGNSTAPHLHFHVSDAPGPLSTEGLPFVFDGYRFLGYARGFTQSVDSLLAPGLGDERRRELPLQNEVVRFRPGNGN